MKYAFVLAFAISALYSVTVKAAELDAQVNAAMQSFGKQSAALKKDAVTQVADFRAEDARREAAAFEAERAEAERVGYEHRGPDHRGGDRRGPDHRGPDHRGPDHRGPDHRGPEPRWPDHRRGRWDHGRNPIHRWRPVHFSRYLGYTWDIEECRELGRAEGFPFVVRYNLSGDCYGDLFPY